MIKALKANYIITSKSRILKDSSVIIEEDKIKDIVPNKLVSKNKYKTINLKNGILLILSLILILSLTYHHIKTINLLNHIKL